MALSKCITVLKKDAAVVYGVCQWHWIAHRTLDLVKHHTICAAILGVCKHLKYMYCVCSNERISQMYEACAPASPQVSSASGISWLMEFNASSEQSFKWVERLYQFHHFCTGSGSSIIHKLFIRDSVKLRLMRIFYTTPAGIVHSTLKMLAQSFENQFHAQLLALSKILFCHTSNKWILALSSTFLRLQGEICGTNSYRAHVYHCCVIAGTD